MGGALQDINMDQDISGTAFAELVMYIEETIMDEDTAPVFRLSDLAHLYKSRMEQLGVNLGSRVQTTCLKKHVWRIKILCWVSKWMSREYCYIVTANSCEHDSSGTQYQGPDGGSNPHSTDHCTK